MKRARLTASLIFSALSFTLTQCSEIQGINTSQNPSGQNNPNGQYESTIVGDGITPIDLSDNTLSFQLDLETNSEAILLMISHNETATQTGFQVLSSESPMSQGFAMQALGVEPEDHTEESHEALRLDEEELFYLQRLENDTQSAGVAATARSGTRNFKIIQSFSDTTQYDTVETVLIYQGDFIHMYLDQRDYADLTDEQIERMLESVEDFDQNVLENEHDIFGQPSDIDNNGIVYVVASREVNEYYDSLGSFVTGYFYAGDTFSTDINPSSNQSEVVFTIIPDADGRHGINVSDTIYFENIFEGVLAHEYQHCINFNERYLQNNANIELPALNEFLSHMAEDLLNDMQTTGIENFSRVSSYLSNVQNICLFCGTSLAQRGGGYLFLRYLFEQANKGHFSNLINGEDLLYKLVHSPYRGIDNLKHTLFGDASADQDFAEWMSRFAIATYLSSTPLSDNDFYQIDGINLRAIANDNRGTFLNGPAIMDLGNDTFTGTLQGTSMAFVKISQNSLNTSGMVYLNVQDASNFKAYLIQ